MSENYDQLIELARKLGRMTYKLKKELGLEEEPRMKPFVRPPARRNVVTSEVLDRAMIARAKVAGIAVEGKSVEEIRKEMALKMGKNRR